MSIRCSDYIPSCLKCSDAPSRRRWLRFGIPAAILVAAAGGVLLLFRFTITPQVKAYVEGARLNSFVSTDDTRSGSAETATSFGYNISISVTLTVRNLNTAPSGIWYTKPLLATFLFHDRLLYNVTVANKGHHHNPLKREVHLLPAGEHSFVFDVVAVEEFKKQNATGTFKVDMRLTGGITLGIGNNRGLELSCQLTLQRPPPPPAGMHPDVVVFHDEVDCEPAKPKKIFF